MPLYSVMCEALIHSKHVFSPNHVLATVIGTGTRHTPFSGSLKTIWQDRQYIIILCNLLQLVCYKGGGQDICVSSDVVWGRGSDVFPEEVSLKLRLKDE